MGAVVIESLSNGQLIWPYSTRSFPLLFDICHHRKIINNGRMKCPDHEFSLTLALVSPYVCAHSLWPATSSWSFFKAMTMATCTFATQGSTSLRCCCCRVQQPHISSMDSEMWTSYYLAYHVHIKILQWTSSVAVQHCERQHGGNVQWWRKCENNIVVCITHSPSCELAVPCGNDKLAISWDVCLLMVMCRISFTLPNY